MICESQIANDGLIVRYCPPAPCYGTANAKIWEK
jgi:hypothetical protein